MQQSYYLIRDKSTIIIGPITPSVLVSHLKEEQFQLSAEISGDLGPWIFLNKASELNDHYPKIKKLLEDHHLYDDLAKPSFIKKIKELFSSKAS